MNFWQCFCQLVKRVEALEEGGGGGTTPPVTGTFTPDHVPFADASGALVIPPDLLLKRSSPRNLNLDGIFKAGSGLVQGGFGVPGLWLKGAPLKTILKPDEVAPVLFLGDDPSVPSWINQGTYIGVASDPNWEGNYIDIRKGINGVFTVDSMGGFRISGTGSFQAYSGAFTVTPGNPPGGNVTTNLRFYSSYSVTNAAYSAYLLGGNVLTSASGTNPQNNYPHFFIQPDDVTWNVAAWSTSGTQIGINASPTFVGSLLDFKVNGVDKFKVDSLGNVTVAGSIQAADDPYDATTWLNNLSVPTKNAVRNKIESMATGGGGAGADPTAKVALTAIPGVATTFMRSDAAPAIDQSIAPTWQGFHTFVAGASTIDQPYDATNWLNNFSIPTKNAIRNKIESITGFTSPYISPIPDGPTAIAFGVDTVNPFADAQSRLFSLKNATSEVFAIEKSGGIKIGRGNPNVDKSAFSSNRNTSLGDSDVMNVYSSVTDGAGAVASIDISGGVTNGPTISLRNLMPGMIPGLVNISCIAGVPPIYALTLGNYVSITPSANDSTSAVAFQFKTARPLANATAKVFSIVNFLDEVFNIRASGITVMKRAAVGNYDHNADSPSAAFSVVSTTQGFLPPKMSMVQRDAIATPAEGLMIFQTDNTPGVRVLEDGVWVHLSAGGGTPSVGADPTVLVGLTAIPGVATTFMRSDAAPALNQGIVPTWTGIHTFSSKVLIGGTQDFGLPLVVTSLNTQQGWIRDMSLNEYAVLTVDPGGSVTFTVGKPADFLMNANQFITSGKLITSSLQTDGPSGTVTPATWKFGGKVDAPATLDTTKHLLVDIDGVLYKIALTT